MFGKLREKLKGSVTKLAEKIKTDQPEESGKEQEGRPELPVKVERPQKLSKAEKPQAIRPSKVKKSGPVKVKSQKPKKSKESRQEGLTAGEKPEAVKQEAKPDAEPLGEIEEEKQLPAREPVLEQEGVADEETVLAEEPEPAKPVEEPKQKGGFLGKIRGIREAVVEKELTGRDIDSFFDLTEAELLQSNIAYEAIEFMRSRMKEELAGKKIGRRGAEQFIQQALEKSLLGLVEQGSISMEDVIEKAKSEGRPACIIFLGFNGAGKTTSIAKVARRLLDKKHSVVLAAGDTFRAASIEQLEHHGGKLGVRVIKHQYGSDSAAVIFDARKHAESKGIEVVLADTAGRMHTDKNLADELKKIIRVNQPDLKVLLVDSLTGNDAVEQAKMFHEMVGVDGVIMAKTDVNEKGGSILSVSYAIKKPILFLGTGQDYRDLKEFRPAEFVRALLE